MQPIDFVAESISPYSVQLSWKTYPTLQLFTLERAEGNAAYEFLTTFPDSTTNYLDESLQPKTTYRYRLTVTGQYGDVSYQTQVITDTPNIPDVQGLEANSLDATSMELSWNSVEGATGYIVERQNADNTFTRLANLDASELSFKNSGLSPGTDYMYRLRVRNEYGISVGINIQKRTFESHSWSTPVKAGRTHEIGGAYPYGEGGALVTEYNLTNNNQFLGFIQPTGEWGPSTKMDFPIHPIATNDQGEIIVAWTTHNGVFVKRYYPISGWGETEFIPSPSPTDYIVDVGRFQVSLASDGTASVVWIHFTNLYASSAKRGGAWEERQLLDSIGEDNIGIGHYLYMASSKSGETFVAWRSATGSTPTYSLRVSHRVGTTWSPAQTLVTQPQFDFVSYTILANDDGSATLLFVNDTAWSVHFDPSTGWSQPYMVVGGRTPKFKVAGNGKGTLIALWVYDSVLYASIYTPKQGWSIRYIVTNDLAFYDPIVKPIVKSNGEIVVLFDKYLSSCSSEEGLFAIRFREVSGWSQSVQMDRKNCVPQDNVQLWLDRNDNVNVLFNVFDQDGWRTSLK